MNNFNRLIKKISPAFSSLFGAPIIDEQNADDPDSVEQQGGDPCISPEQVAEFAGMPAVVDTYSGDIYTGYVTLEEDSEFPVVIYRPDCCEQTHLDYCEIAAINPPPPCSVYAPACCIGCLPENIRFFFNNPTGTCADCAPGEGVVIDLEKMSQFGQYRFDTNDNPFATCGGAEAKFTAKFECDEDFDLWTLEMFWEENDIECKAEAEIYIENCSTMAAEFNIAVSCNSVCKGTFQVTMFAV